MKPLPSYKLRPEKKATINNANTNALNAKGISPMCFSPAFPTPFIPLSDPPSAGPDVSHLDYNQAIKNNNSTDGSTHPFGIENT
jgi:hypothetical protein